MKSIEEIEAEMKRNPTIKVQRGIVRHGLQYDKWTFKDGATMETPAEYRKANGYCIAGDPRTPFKIF